MFGILEDLYRSFEDYEWHRQHFYKSTIPISDPDAIKTAATAAAAAVALTSCYSYQWGGFVDAIVSTSSPVHQSNAMLYYGPFQHYYNFSIEKKRKKKTNNNNNTKKKKEKEMKCTLT